MSKNTMQILNVIKNIYPYHFNRIYWRLKIYLRQQENDIREVGDRVSWSEQTWLEFKLSHELSTEDLAKGEKPQELYFNICQAIMALANSHGGLLIIGLADDYKESGKICTFDELINSVNPTFEIVKADIRSKIFPRLVNAFHFTWQDKIKSEKTQSVDVGIILTDTNMNKLNKVVHFINLNLGGREVVGILVEKVHDNELITFDRIKRPQKGEHSRESCRAMVRQLNNEGKIESIEKDLNLLDVKDKYLHERIYDTEEAC
ncbi:MAG: ATP-binding protein, partial [Lentisphaerota bacterium]